MDLFLSRSLFVYVSDNNFSNSPWNRRVRHRHTHMDTTQTTHSTVLLRLGRGDEHVTQGDKGG